MAENSKISWTDHTFNPWIGCDKVAPGCDNCYAEARDVRFGEGLWGKDKARKQTSEKYWNNPLRWQRKAEETGESIRVFCGSLCDWTDNRAPDGLRERLWELIRNTPNLNWLLLTKRAPNIAKCLPDDWGKGYPNVWLGVTVENRQHGLKRMEILQQIPARLRFISAEPLLEDLGEVDLQGIDWVIAGGESGPNARVMKRPWLENLKQQSEEQDKAFFFKQWGGSDMEKGGSLFNGIEIKALPVMRAW